MHFIYTILAALFLFAAPLAELSSEIYEIRLTVGNMECSFCGRSVRDTLKTVPGVENAEVFYMDGFVDIFWKNNMPFQAVQLIKKLGSTQFALKEIDVDVEGTIVEKKKALVLESKPENSHFYIEDRRDSKSSELKVGQIVRVKGIVTNQHGFNFINVREILPEVTPTTE